MADPWEKQRLYQEAAKEVLQARDGSRSHHDLVEQLAAKLPDIDQTELKRKQARDILYALTERGATEPSGQLSFFDNFRVDYEPGRLLPDDEGNVVEQREAKPRFKWLEAQRAAQKAKEERRKIERQIDKADLADKISDHIAEEAKRYAAWFHRQIESGRPEDTLNFDLYLREEGPLE